MNSLEQEIDQLKQNISSKNQMLEEKNKKIEELNQRVSNLEVHMQKKLNEIESLRKTKSELERNVKNNQQTKVLIKEVPREIKIEKIVEKIVEKPVQLVVEKAVEKIVEVENQEAAKVLMEEIDALKKENKNLKTKAESASAKLMEKSLEVEALRNKFKDMAKVCVTISDSNIAYKQQGSKKEEVEVNG